MVQPVRNGRAVRRHEELERGVRATMKNARLCVDRIYDQELPERKTPSRRVHRVPDARALFRRLDDAPTSRVCG